LRMHGTDGIRFYTRSKTVTTRWPAPKAAAPGCNVLGSGRE
jgi:hypothetical protein